MLENSGKTWFTGEGNGKLHQYSCLENPMNSMKRQSDRTLKDELSSKVGAQYTMGVQLRNNFRMLQPGRAETRTCPLTGACNKLHSCVFPSNHAEQSFLGWDLLSTPLHCLHLHPSPWKQNNILLFNSRAWANYTPQHPYSPMISCDYCQ